MEPTPSNTEAYEAFVKLNDLMTVVRQYLDSLGESRELSMAKAKLEEVQLWAMRHIIR